MSLTATDVKIPSQKFLHRMQFIKEDQAIRTFTQKNFQKKNYNPFWMW